MTPNPHKIVSDVAAATSDSTPHSTGGGATAAERAGDSAPAVTGVSRSTVERVAEVIPKLRAPRARQQRPSPKPSLMPGLLLTDADQAVLDAADEWDECLMMGRRAGEAEHRLRLRIHARREAQR